MAPKLTAHYYGLMHVWGSLKAPDGTPIAGKDIEIWSYVKGDGYESWGNYATTRADGTFD